MKSSNGGLFSPRSVRPFLFGALIAAGTIVVTYYLVAHESALKCMEHVNSGAKQVAVEQVKPALKEELVKPK